MATCRRPATPCLLSIALLSSPVIPTPPTLPLPLTASPPRPPAPPLWTPRHAAAALVSPAVRMAKLLHQSSSVPRWGSSYMQRGWLQLRAAQLAFVAPLVAALLPVRPLAAVWGLGDAAAWGWPMAAALAVAAGAQLVAVRPMLQVGGGVGVGARMVRMGPCGWVLSRSQRDKARQGGRRMPQAHACHLPTFERAPTAPHQTIALPSARLCTTQHSWWWAKARGGAASWVSEGQWGTVQWSEQRATTSLWY